MVIRNWNRLVDRVKQEVAAPSRVVYVTASTLPTKYVGFKGTLGFQLDDGTIYINTSVVKKHNENAQEILRHELAHRVLGHKQPKGKSEEGELKTESYAVLKRAMTPYIQHEIEVNILLHKAFNEPTASQFAGEVRGWVNEQRTVANMDIGDIFTVIHKEVLDNPDIPVGWKRAVVAMRKKGAKKLADKFGHDVEYVDKILDYGKIPEEFNNLIKYVWFGIPFAERDDEDADSINSELPDSSSVAGVKTENTRSRKPNRRGRSAATPSSLGRVSS